MPQSFKRKERGNKMTRSFKDAKKSRMGFEDLTTKMEKAESSKSYGEKDPALWYPELDKAKNGYAVIRFLPEKDTDLPWVKTYSHGFKKNNNWFIEECPTTIDAKCPVCESNSELWNSGVDSDKDIARDRKRRQSWYANVLILQDDKNPENVGQVKIFKFGFKIFQKIKDKLTPPEAFADESPVNIFDFWEGANFKLKIRKVEGMVNYDSSSFEDPSQLCATDKEMEVVWDGMHDIGKFVAPDVFKSYEDLDKRLQKVLGNDAKPARTAEEIVETETHNESQTEAPTKEAATAESSGDADAAEEDTMSFFKNMAEED